MTTPLPPSLLTCSPRELALYLHRQRFDSNDMATATFLLSCTSELPNAESISQQLMGNNNESDDDPQESTDNNAIGSDETTTNESSLGSIMVDPVVVSALTPRGKQEVTLYTKGVTLTHPKTGDSVQVPCHCVQHVVVFPKPETCRRFTTTSSSKEHHQTQNDMILMVFSPDSDIRYKQKALSQICFSIPNDDTTTGPSSSWLKQLAQSLQWNNDDDPSKSIIQVASPQNKFVSDSGGEQGSTTTSGMPFVKCYKGVHDGALFPLEEGLLFFKPPLFVHRSKMHSISCGRGSGPSRYVDLRITLEDEHTNGEQELEFTNINRPEVTVLNQYIHKVLIPAMTADAASPSNTHANHNNHNLDDDDDDDDDEEEMSVEEPQNGRTSSRAASREAREATRAQLEQGGGASDEEDNNDDDDDDSDEEEPNSEEDDSSDENDGEEELAALDAEQSDDDDESYNSNFAVTSSDDDNESEENDDTESEEEAAPPKKKRKS